MGDALANKFSRDVLICDLHLDCIYCKTSKQEHPSRMAHSKHEARAGSRTLFHAIVASGDACQLNPTRALNRRVGNSRCSGNISGNKCFDPCGNILTHDHYRGLGLPFSHPSYPAPHPKLSKVFMSWQPVSYCSCLHSLIEQCGVQRFSVSMLSTQSRCGRSKNTVAIRL